MLPLRNTAATTGTGDLWTPSNNKTESIFMESVCSSFENRFIRYKAIRSTHMIVLSLHPPPGLALSRIPTPTVFLESSPPSLSLSPGGLERHALTIEGGVQPFTLGIDLPLVPSKREEQVNDTNALDRLWDSSESPNTLPQPGLPLPTAKVSFTGWRQDTNVVLDSYYGGEENGNSVLQLAQHSLQQSACI
ncbi:hypothetical protein DL96DRAFT_1628160 [Flagelloscypha sp. PMI_526]|nr:hypothetical protein DL96DRAFT_1628160 [Flagelloscypha sp. PMI_526]